MWPNVVENILRQSARPSLCVLVTHGNLPVPDVFIDAMSEQSIEHICDSLHALVNPGVLTNHAFNHAADWCADDALMCTMDDDDWYGENYLDSMLKAYAEHPDAWLLGKSAYTTRYIGFRSDRPNVDDAGRIVDTQGHTKSLAGSTICVPSALWNAHSTLRFPDMGLGCDSEFIQTAARLSGTDPAPIYHVPDAEFYLQRYAVPTHIHAWRDPRD